MNYRQINKRLTEYGFSIPVKGIEVKENKYTREKTMGKKLVVKKVVDIKDGLHEGVIKAVIFRDAPYEYVDLVIRLPDATGTELKVGYPATISKSSSLGNLLLRFNQELKEDSQIDVEQILKERKCSFMTLKKKNDKGQEFSNVIPESVKPL